MLSETQFLLQKLSEGTISTKFGEFKMTVFHDGNVQGISLSLGQLDGAENVYCRMHSDCISSHIFSSIECDCQEQMESAQQMISKEGKGIIIFLSQEGRGHGAAAHVATLDYKKKGISQDAAYEMAGFEGDNRKYDIAAKIIQRMQIRSIILLTNNKNKRESLIKNGIKITSTLDTNKIYKLGPGLPTLIDNVIKGSIDPLFQGNRRIFILGDLNVDYFYSVSNETLTKGAILEKQTPLVGGTGFNAARAFRDNGFNPILYGNVGSDNDGSIIFEELNIQAFNSIIAVSKTKQTGNCQIFYIGNEQKKQRILVQESDNANDYSVDQINKSLLLCKIGSDDIIFLVGHCFARCAKSELKALITCVQNTGAKLILDLVPHDLYTKISLEDFLEVIGNKIDVIISEYQVLRGFLDLADKNGEPSDKERQDYLKLFPTRFLVIRYGEANIGKQDVCKNLDGGGYEVLDKGILTGYSTAPVEEKLGFGDRLTAELLLKYYDQLMSKQ